MDARTHRVDAPRREAGGERRTALIEAATQLVREGGFGSANVKAVTARAGMSAGLLYRYADGIDGLLAEVFRRSAGIELAAVDRAVAAAPDDAVARLAALAEAFTTRALAGRRLAWALLAEPVGPAIDAERLAYRRSYAGLVAGIVEQGIAEGVFPAQDVRISAAGIVGAIGESLIGPLSPVADDAVAPEVVVDAVRRLCLRALGARAASIDPNQPERTAR